MFSASGNSIANQKSEIGNRYTFQGREIDWDTGLTYFRARWYNPETGRWLSKDPIGISGGLNLYAFVGNNPVNFTDPSGLNYIVAKGIELICDLTGNYSEAYGAGQMMKEFRDEVEALEKIIPVGETRTGFIRIDGYTDLRDSKDVLRSGPPKTEYVSIKVTIHGKKKPE